VNGAGTTIMVSNITVVNNDGTRCHCIINGSNMIPPGKEFKMGGTACSADHYVGDQFLINLRINYNTTVGGVDVERVENGTIRGTYGGAIKGIIPADSDIQGCLGVGAYWLGDNYCDGGDDCASKPKCCGDDSGEYYKISWSSACCAHNTSCSGVSIVNHVHFT